MARRSLPLLVKAAPECVVALADNSCTATVQGEDMYIVNQLFSYICMTCVLSRSLHNFNLSLEAYLVSGMMHVLMCMIKRRWQGCVYEGRGGGVKNLHLSMVHFSIGVPYTTLEGFPVLC